MTPGERVAGLVARLRGGGAGALLARGAGAFFLIHAGGVGISFAVQVLLARTLGADRYGTYVYAFSWMVLLLLLCRFGLGTASVRFVAAYVAEEDWGRLRGYLSSIRWVVLAASGVVALATALALLALGDRLPRATTQTLLVCCLCMPAYALVQVGVQVLRGFQRVLTSQIPATVLQPGLLGALVLGVWLALPERLDAPAAMGLTLVSVLGALGFVVVAMRRATPPEVRSAAAVTTLRPWLRIALPLMFFNVLNVGLERTDILLIGSLLGSTDAGVYASGRRVATVISFGLVAVGAWAAPQISGLHSQGDHLGLQRFARVSARAIFAFTLPSFLLVVGLGKPILSLFGPEFTRAYGVLVILAGGQLVNALAGPVGLLLTMTGRQDTATRIMGVHALLMPGLAWLLIPRYGIEGAAAATALIRVSWNVSMVVATWRSMRLRATIF